MLIKVGDWLIGRQRNSADAAEVNTRTAQSLLAEVDKRRKEDRAEYEMDLAELRRRVRELEQNAHARDVLAAQHAPWDRQVTARLEALGQHVDQPPPLYLPEH